MSLAKGLGGCQIECSSGILKIRIPKAEEAKSVGHRRDLAGYRWKFSFLGVGEGRGIQRDHGEEYHAGLRSPEFAALHVVWNPGKNAVLFFPLH